MLTAPAVAAGIYLPLTAVLGGRLFVTPKGYHEAQRDVINLSADIAELTQQQGHMECQPKLTARADGTLRQDVPLHCALEVTPAQVKG